MVSMGRGLCSGVLLIAYIIQMMTLKAMGCIMLYIIDGSFIDASGGVISTILHPSCINMA